MMFWRILWKLFRASRGRLAVALVAVTSGAAVCSALISLQLDAERKLTREFRALGANVVVAPPRAGGADAPLMDAMVLNRISAAQTPQVVGAAPYLYVVARAPRGEAEQSVILTGTWLDHTLRLAPWWKVEGQWIATREDISRCLVGRNAARQLGLSPGGAVELRYADRPVKLAVAQQLAALEGRVSLAQLSVIGSPSEIEGFAQQLSAALPGLEVRPVRQLAQAEGQLLTRIRGLIFATVALILVLTALCVLATMAALAMERRRDVGMMKALGGPMSRVLRLFLAEAATLGVLGGLLGYAAGVGLAQWMGQRVFGVAISPRLEVLPLTILLMFGVALAGAFPLRLLSAIRPAAILRGE